MNEEQLYDALLRLRLASMEAFVALTWTTWRNHKADVSICKICGVPASEQGYNELQKFAMARFPRAHTDYAVQWDELVAKLKTLEPPNEPH